MNEIAKKECPETSSSLILYMYGESADPRAFEAHLATCDDCSNALAANRRALNEYRNEVVPLPGSLPVVFEPSFMDKVREFFLNPVFRPIYATAVVAMIVGAFFIGNNTAVVRIEAPNTGPAFSYSRMDVALEGVEEDVESLIGFNDGYFVADARESNVDAISNELNDISEDIRNF